MQANKAETKTLTMVPNNDSAGLLPLVVDAAALLFYVPTMFLNKARIRVSTFNLCLVFLLSSVLAPFVWLESMMVFYPGRPLSRFLWFIANSYPVVLMTVGALFILHDLYRQDKRGK